MNPDPHQDNDAGIFHPNVQAAAATVLCDIRQHDVGNRSLSACDVSDRHDAFSHERFDHIHHIVQRVTVALV